MILYLCSDPGRREKRQAQEQEQEMEISEEAVADCGQDPDMSDAMSAACQFDWMFMGREVILSRCPQIEIFLQYPGSATGFIYNTKAGRGKIRYLKFSISCWLQTK